MPRNRVNMKVGRLIAVCLAVSGLLASEHHGVVKSGNVPIPGATVTATQGDKKLVTTTDEQGVYSFRDLADGVWNVQVEMLGFTKKSQEIGVAANAPSPSWDLKLLSASDLRNALSAPNPEAPKPAAPASPETPKPAAAAATTATATAQPPARTPQNGQRQGGDRPSIRASQQGQGGGRGGRGGGFQRAEVNASSNGEGAQAPNDFAADAPSADLSQSANDALVIGGSVSSGIGMPQENDWFAGRGGMGPNGMGFGPGMGGFGGPGMGDGVNGANGDNPQLAMGGGRGGPGGGGPGGGGPGGGRGFGGPGGGGPGGGFGGGFGGGRGGFGGGPGGRGGGRDGARGPGGRNMNAFGNGRRNARSRYNGNLAIIEDNSALNARPYSLTGQDTPKPSTQNARITAMFGGPLKIPHLISGQKTNFNINYQFARARTGSTLTTLLPTAAERAGDFSQATNLQGTPVTIYDPTTGQPFAGNVIPQARLSPQAAGLLAFYPLPNFTNNQRYNYQTSIVGASDQDNINSRVSHTLNTKNQFSGNFSYQRASGNSPNLFGFVSSSHQSAVNTGVNWTYHFSARTINTIGYTFSRNTQRTDPFFANRVNVSGQLGITGNNQDPNYWGPPSLSFANGFQGLSDANTALNRAQTSAITETVRYFHKTHNFTFGGDVRRVQSNPLSQSNPRGTFGFTGANTALNGVGGFDLADFMLGLPDTSQIAYGNADKYFRSNWFSIYGTDDWRISTKLSLNLGLRWDYQTPTTELYGRLVNLQIGPGFSSASTVCATNVAGCTPAGQAGYPSSLIHGDPREIQPRIGYAWRPLTKGSLVIRGGYGIYYNTSVYQALVSQMSQQSPLSYSLIDSATQAPLTLANGFPVLSLTPITTFAVDPNFRIGYAQSWQTSIQQNLPWSMVATVTYSGAKGTHQAQEFIPNSAPPGSKPACASCPTNFYYMTSGANTIANNLWLQLQRRFRSGFAGNLSYAHANSIDNGSAGGGGRGGGGGGARVVAQNWQDLEAERARTAGIRTHTLSAMMQYSTGMGARGGALTKGFRGKLLRDWTVMTNITVASGAPLTPTVLSRALGGTGITGPLRAFYTGQPVFTSDGVLNPAAFITPPPGLFGNAGRNIITGPNQFSLNGSASRTIRLGERRSADFRIDARNALNHVSFGSWNTTVGSTQFGLLQAPGAMRSLTATLRLRF